MSIHSRSFLIITFSATVTLADVNVSYDPAVIDMGDGEQGLDINAVSNPGLDLAVAGFGFDYNTNSDAWTALNPQGFDWSDVIDDLGWTTDNSLPGPFAGGANALLLVDGVEVHIATLLVDPVATGEFSLDSGMTAVDPDAGPLSIKGGDPFTFSIVPEPSGLILMAMGLALVARRR